MGGVLGHIRAAADVLVHHRRVVDKGQMLHIHAQIRPVDGQNILTPLRQLQRVKHLLRGVRAGAQHVGVLLLQHL